MKALLLIVGGLVVWGAVTGETGATGGGPPTAATEIPTHGGHGSTLVGLLVVAGLMALFVKAGPGRGAGRVASGRRVSRHVHGAACGCGGRHTARGWGGKRSLTRHERDGHVRAIRKAGGGGATWKVWRDADGWAGVTTPRSSRRVAKLPPEKQIAILRAGIAAAPGTTSPTDGPDAAEILRGVPRRDRARMDSEANRLVGEWIR